VLVDRVDMVGAELAQTMSVELRVRSASGELSAPGPAVSIDFPADTDAPQITMQPIVRVGVNGRLRWDGSEDVAFYKVVEQQCIKATRCSWRALATYSGGAGPYTYRIHAAPGLAIKGMRILAEDLAGHQTVVEQLASFVSPSASKPRVPSTHRASPPKRAALAAR
jgi:hypothetical protein